MVDENVMLTRDELADLLDGKPFSMPIMWVNGDPTRWIVISAKQALNEPRWNRNLTDIARPGLFHKFNFFRRHGENKPYARLFVLDMIGDPWATEAARLYADLAERDGVPELATEMRRAIEEGLREKLTGDPR